ncbi:MAG: hypothetical protein GY703_15850 [Gammaproteobacteria bacterium]|nr:hypothetical protein [Gammaproteobacteria bacterium]
MGALQIRMVTLALAMVAIVPGCFGNSKVQAVGSGGPFEIKLNLKGKRLWVSLKNLSPEPQLFLHDGFFQPSRIVISLNEGDELSAFDTRSLIKTDNTLYRALYRNIAPGDEVILAETKLESGKEGYRLRWLPFEFDSIQSGEYGVRVVWESEMMGWTDSETGQSGSMDAIWLGRLESASLRMKLP